MVSNKRQKNEEQASYLFEILPDYQRRQRMTINNVHLDPNEIMANLNTKDTSTKSRIKKYFVEFASNCSIHGFNHVAARYRHPLERFLASMFILGGFVCFIYVSIVSWYRYQNAGFITLMNQQQELIRLVKPALIICPRNIINETKFPATFERYGIEDTPKIREFFHFISNASYHDIACATDYQEVPPPELWLRILNDLKIEFHYETSLSGEGLWIAVEGGLCYSIGSYIHPYASIEYILADNWTVSTLPKYPPQIENYQMERKELNDPNYLPSYVYQPNQDIEEFFKLSIDAWVDVTDPLEVYKMKGPRQMVQVSEEFHNIVRVNKLLTSQGMENVPQNRRLCKVHKDKGLTMWPMYSFEMCLTEYRAHLAKKACGCYTHISRRMPGVPVCNITQLDCIAKYNTLITRSPAIPRPYRVCSFNCNQIGFLVTTIKLENTSLKNYSYVKMTMIFPSYRFTIRERFSFIDFMTAVGSAAGLFLGCSVLSAIEIFYYCTLRLYTNIKKHK